MRFKPGKHLFIAPLAAMGLCGNAAFAQISNDVVKIGVIADMSGVYSAHSGVGTVNAVKMAVKDFGGKLAGKNIEVLSIDYQNKVDIALSRAREWYDRENVDMIIEGTDSATAIALQKLGESKKKITIFPTAATTRLTESDCSPFGIHYTYDTYALANATGKLLTQAGNKSWYFLTADYAFGHQLEADTTNVVKELGGNVLGTSRHPLATSDFASILMKAQASGAKVIGFANAGMDTQNAMRQAAEFGLGANGKQVLAPLLLFITDVKGMGVEKLQGVQFVSGFYWDRTDETRAWAKRYYEIQKAMPSMAQAGAYSATMHYLKSIQAAGTDEGEKVMKVMKSTPINDAFAHGGKILENGQMVHDMYLVEVKKPSEKKGDWDLLKVKEVIPGEKAFRTMSQSTCVLNRS